MIAVLHHEISRVRILILHKSFSSMQHQKITIATEMMKNLGPWSTTGYDAPAWKKGRHTADAFRCTRNLGAGLPSRYLTNNATTPSSCLPSVYPYSKFHATLVPVEYGQLVSDGKDCTTTAGGTISAGDAQLPKILVGRIASLLPLLKSISGADEKTLQ